MESYITKFAPGNHENEEAVENVINYIYRGAKKDFPSQKRIYGAIGCGSSNPERVIEAFHKVKKVYHKTEGSQLKHIIVSFGCKPDQPVEKIRSAVKEIVKFFSKSYMTEGNFQVAYGIHCKNENNYHLHICVNSVSNKGLKINLKNKKWREFKEHVSRIWDGKINWIKKYKIDV